MTAEDSVKRHRNIVALVGSLRRDSYNRMLFNAALELAPPEMTITELTGWQQWPLLNLDEVADGMLEPVTQMARQITESDGVLFVSPEYNYSIPGGLKNTIDWLSRVDPQPFAGKAVGLMGAATGAVAPARTRPAAPASRTLRNIGFPLRLIQQRSFRPSNGRNSKRRLSVRPGPEHPDAECRPRPGNGRHRP